MKEGINKRISLGGIVRNTAGSISPDGQMDEMINLRLKDGSFRPMSPNVPLDGIKDVNIDYTNIFIHSCDYRHWIGVKDGKTLVLCRYGFKRQSQSNHSCGVNERY